LTEFFEDQTDDAKLLATISNDYSKFNTSIFASSNTPPEDQRQKENKWYTISKMVLSRLHYITMLVKYSYLVEDINNKNFPFYYEKQSKVYDAINDWVKETEKIKPELENILPRKSMIVVDGRCLSVSP
jgi:hypothetical protein